MDETYIRRWAPENVGLDFRAERIKDTKKLNREFDELNKIKKELR